MSTRILPRITLTTEHAASSYGQPVALIRGQAYGRADVYGGQPVAALVRAWADGPRRSAEQRRLAAKFLGVQP